MPPAPPVSLPRPVLQVPGCVPSHPDAQLNPSLLRDDPGRVGYVCDAPLPSIDAMDFRPSQLTVIEGEAPPAKREADQAPPAAELPQLPRPGPAAVVPAAPSAPIVQQVLDGLPEVPAVVNTTSIALVATTSALLAKPLADLLLKLIKPAVKKAVAKIKAKLGRKIPVLSLSERRLAQRDRNRAVLALRRALRGR